MCNISHSATFSASFLWPKIAKMMSLGWSQLSVVFFFQMSLCEYIRMQYTVNWFLLWSSLIWILSDSQGWLTLASTPYRSSLDSVTVDGKQWLPWLAHCVSVYPKNGLTLPEGGVRMCVFLSAWVCVLWCASIWKRCIPEENVTSSGKNQHARWCEQMVKEDEEERYEEAGESFINSPKTQNCQPSTLVQACVHRVLEM